MKKNLNDPAKLSPRYTVKFQREYPNDYITEYCEDSLRWVPVAFTEKEARKIVAEAACGAKAYHYGYKERGFRAGEVACTTLCVNDLYVPEPFERV